MTTTGVLASEEQNALQLSLSGVAVLAQVQRPVASMWRRRFAVGDDAFPQPVALKSGAPVFDAQAVADWLVRTGHGNNPSAIADAAASAAPAGFDWADPRHVAELQALITLSARTGGLAGRGSQGTRDEAIAADPDDRHLLREVTGHVDQGRDWTAFADQLIDAAYSPSGALDVVHARHAGTKVADGSAGALAPAAWELVLDVAAALARRGQAGRVVVDRGVDAESALAIVTHLDEQISPHVEETERARGIRRRFLVEDVWLDEGGDVVADLEPAVRVARVPVSSDDDVERMLADAEHVALALDRADTAVLVGPARALIGALPPAARRIRDDVLRSGRLRAAVRLPRGLVNSAPQDALALWVLGPPHIETALDERVTVTADLIDADLTEGARDDVVSDVIAGMGSGADVRARTFRFAQLPRTASLLARTEALLAPRSRRRRGPSHAGLLAARLDAAAQAAASDAPGDIAVAPGAGDAVEPAALADLISAGHIRLVSGTRLAPGSIGDSGLVVVTADDVDDPSQIGAQRVDPMTFAHRHPHAQLTRPGDVIFRTGSAAWVDPDGSKVVAYPARVLRITAADPGGLVPELVAADIAAQPAAPGAWRRWMLRRVAPASIAPLRSALAELADVRTGLERRIADLDHYADTLTAAVAAGAVTVTHRAAAAAPDPK